MLYSTCLAIAAALAMTAANCLAGTSSPALGGAASKPQHDDALAGIVDRFLAKPNKENFTALQARVIADPGFDRKSQGLTDMLDLYKHKRYREALDRYHACAADLLLSGQAHFYAARCYEELGQKEMQKKEMAYVRACLQGLLATGDGSPERPIVVTHVSDEYDLLTCPFQTESKSQSLTEKKGRWYDVLECSNGKTYWFDVTLTLGRGHARSDSATASAAKPAATKAELAKAAYDRGVKAIGLNDYDRAIIDLNEAIRFDSTSADTYFQRGFALIEKHNPVAAYVDLCEAIRLRSDYALAYYERGLCLRQEGDKYRRDDAMADFSAAIRLDSSNFLFWRERALLWFAKQDYAKAIDDNTTAIWLKPDDAMSYNNRGFAYESTGEFSKAIADFNQAIRLRPQFAQAYAGRGFAWLQRNEYDLAIADLDEAIRLKPDYAAAYAYRSAAYTHKGDEARARSDANLATDLRQAGNREP
jgi:tetratricopeptide (TPR) repeat protein